MLSLLLLAAVMAVITLAAGFAPLYMPADVNIKALSQLGSGVIIGTAFLVVIPEGYEQIGEAHHRVAGVAVLAGFMLMLVIGTFLGKRAPADPRDSRGTVDLSDLRTAAPDSQARSASPQNTQWGGWLSGISVTTLGLAIHAAADGIALGAAEASNNVSLKALIFVSILIHKAPAAFSLTAILLTYRGYSAQQIKRDAVLFALAGPVTAVLVGLVLELLEVSGDSFWPGVALALSGGTFVYVAMHVLSELTDTRHSSADPTGPPASPTIPLALVALGMVPPFLATYLPD